MKNLYILLFLFANTLFFAQEKVSSSQLYTTKGITYKESDNSLFTGINEFRKSNGHLVFEKEYINGYLAKYTLYYNGNERIISSETFYQDKSNIKKKHISYPYHDTLMTITDFDDNGKKELEEQFISNKLIYHCEYLNGKKHGVTFSIDKNNIKNICKYANGKRISSSKEAVNVR